MIELSSRYVLTLFDEHKANKLVPKEGLKYIGKHI
jgi:hypothetical protein